jgi:lipopolysaccharide/colanic/teichoic acid biosynthesis glycosyltransferase
VRRLARVLLATGIAGTVLGLSLLHAARNGYAFQGSFRFGWALTYIGVLAVTTYAVGLPDLPRRRSRLLTAAAATALGAGAVSLLQLFLGDALLPRLVVFGSAALLVPWLMICAAVAAGGRARAEERDRIVVVGDFDEGATLQLELDDAPERPAQVVDVVRLDAARGAEGEEPLIDRVIAAGGTVLVMSRAAQDDLRLVDQAAVLHEAGVRVRTLSKFYEDWLGKLPIGELERVSLMFDIGEVHGDRYSRVKRLLDVVCGAVGTVLLLPALAVVAAGNHFGNRGRLFYRQERVGRDGRRFTIVKFRTMRPSDGRLANEWTQEDDPRITPFGRFLRRSHLDELPQVLNILRGDLSLVGPRPEQPQYVDELRDKIPFYDLRHLVRPGLTGWAQVKFGYAGDERDALEKLQYEFFYLRHQSLGLDLRIVGRTLRELVVGRNGR